jgi:hypothetical protein
MNKKAAEACTFAHEQQETLMRYDIICLETRDVWAQKESGECLIMTFEQERIAMFSQEDTRHINKM